MAYMIDLLDFRNYLIRSKYSNGTIRNYLLYCKKIEGIEITQLSINEFCDKYNTNIARACLKVLMKSIGNTGVCVPGFMGRRKQRLPHYLILEEINLLIASANLRNKVMISLAFEGGLRNSEVTSLTLDHILFEQNQIRSFGKGNKEFIVYFSNKTKKILLEYIKAKKIIKKDQPLFKIGRHGFYQSIVNLGKKVLNKKVYPHMLRHSTATYLLNMGWNIKQVQIYMRHTNLETTGIYLHLDPTEIKNKFQDTFKPLERELTLDNGRLD